LKANRFSTLRAALSKTLRAEITLSDRGSFHDVPLPPAPTRSTLVALPSPFTELIDPPLPAAGSPHFPLGRNLPWCLVQLIFLFSVRGFGPPLSCRPSARFISWFETLQHFPHARAKYSCHFSHTLYAREAPYRAGSSLNLFPSRIHYIYFILCCLSMIFRRGLFTRLPVSSFPLPPSFSVVFRKSAA